ncbi:MAG: M20/M25/M40 family metallo-hydrolase [Bacteroidetes bacterium]|nr:M20/M25/M40 family metallo-hydrolase [Bacteroidota bacterium]
MQRTNFFFLLSLSGILIFYTLSAQPSKTEKRIAAEVDLHAVQALDLLKEVVNINSGTFNFGGVKQVGAVFTRELKALGFETKWISGETFHRAGHVLATHKGKRGKKILLIGHLDTVFEPDSPFQTFEMLNDSMMHGPGAADMKGGDVIIILALQALRDAGLLADLNIEVIMSGDEEASGFPLALSKYDLIEAAKRADYALGYEDGDGLATKAVIERRGASDWTLTVKGHAAHSSQLFTAEVGNGAIYEASRILKTFYDSLKGEENLTFNPGLIAGGNTVNFDSLHNQASAFGKNNIVAQDVIVKGDLRAVSTMQVQRVKKSMQKIVAENFPNTTAHIDFGENGYPPMTATEGNKKLLKYYSRVSTDLGFPSQEAVNPRDAGAADICFVNDWVEMALDGIGLPGTGGHTIHETANTNYLAIEAKRSAVLIYRLAFEKALE